MKWIYHEHEARVIYSLMTDRQSVIYWATNHLLARLCFDSNTQETTKKQLYPSDFFQFSAITRRNPANNIDCNTCKAKRQQSGSKAAACEARL